MSKLKKISKLVFKVFICLLLILITMTLWDIHTPNLNLQANNSPADRFQVLDRQGVPLGISYQNHFNTSNIIPLHQIPDLLRQAFITSEDKNFFSHNGIDWPARLSAVWQNLKAARKVRGASTITEQVVRIIHPRPRTLWSRWLEGFEAVLLERRAGKAEILEFYLNQVPYAANRRGVAQAARYYFNRDLDTLSHKEMLALTVLPRAPSALDLYGKPELIGKSVVKLAKSMEQRRELSPNDVAQLELEKITLEPPPSPIDASHFISYIRETVPYQLSDNGILQTTLDANLQYQAQNLLNERIKSLKRKQVHNGAVLIVDHTTGEILAWAVGGNGDKDLQQNTPGHAIDAIRTPRQPGSSMKPFLYALALDSGWSPATELDDAPMAEAIGSGLHDFHNYSRTFYGKISLREALGNSLNIPALETIAYVGPGKYLDKLHQLGFSSLTKPVEFYKEGLALGNGEVTLYEMVQGYSALANRGVFRPLTPLAQAPYTRENTQAYSEEATSLIGNILSDAFARRREFGAGSVLNLPVQTAVKTGTSTDFRDAWVLGFDSHYTVGVWLGNLDQVPMDGITGSTGPALVLRSIFAELAKRTPPQPLYLSPKLAKLEICSNSNQTTKDNCYPRTEYFIPGTEKSGEHKVKIAKGIKLVRPTEGLQIAYDPRLPADRQAFEFVLDSAAKGKKIDWVLNGNHLSQTDNGRLMWPVQRGHYILQANELGENNKISSTDYVHFNVK